MTRASRSVTHEPVDRPRGALPDTSKLELSRRDDGLLWANQFGRSAAVQVRRCFPWTQPGRYFSLCTADNEEFAFVSDPAALDAESRRALERSLDIAGFVFRIVKVHSVREDFELRCFEVDTPQGPRTFQTALDTWPRETPEGGLLIEDVAGDVFRIDHPAELDARSRELVWELVD
jgi:hypothetical protein